MRLKLGKVYDSLATLFSAFVNSVLDVEGPARKYNHLGVSDDTSISVRSVWLLNAD